MARTRTHPRLHVYQNGEIVGYLSKQTSGAVEFIYEEKWLSNKSAYPVSLSLPLREDAFKGAPVVAVFENLLPDSEDLRSRVAEKVGAEGTDAYSLLTQIGRDCVGALQFFPEGADIDFSDLRSIKGEAVSDNEIERILNNLSRAPLGLNRDDDFRISVAGAQEKTALLYHEGQWIRPSGPTPTTHILKTQIGRLNSIDLSNSVENEFYCLALMDAFGIPVNKAKIKTFGNTKSLVIERFDRKRSEKGLLLRVPQEDCCQALSIPPSRKYQNDSRPSKEKQPSMAEILNLLKGSDRPAHDQKLFLKAQILFWLIGATDGHAKNFSLFLGSGGSFQLTPLYDVLTVQPYYNALQLRNKEMKMAMSVGDNRHYRMEDIQGRHFSQTAERAGLPSYIAQEALEEISDTAERAIQKIEERLPSDFPENIHETVAYGMKSRLQNL
ncbi:MAG: type II toxin-antitoxin system HipA family toxin [Alphaproteobacteria bacterium]|jgi:serine/threonine-protein kinase HipA|nr:type II toxin-antitoxin system HipA family toxin [Alphaproteobacteria bacterium]QQS58255.1 MAG: type II toxin-antitoxin system HipA family toxin [Alphaproteobacteria bacterium]